MRAVVVGGGIGGLCAAIALQRKGVEALVLERAARLDAGGSGIGLARNALGALEQLGVAEAVRARGAPAERGVSRTWRGEVLTDLAWGGVSIHRADLQATLLEALGPECVRLGTECAGFEQDAAGVTAQLADGSEERGDVLVGADGLHSMVRAHLVARQDLRYSGATSWRGRQG